jgi:hypothetical protein
MRLLSLRRFFQAVQENSSQITIRDRQDIGSSSRFNDNNVLMAAQDDDDKSSTYILSTYREGYSGSATAPCNVMAAFNLALECVYETFFWL